MDTQILTTVGDDPLRELMDVDRFYGWSRRISIMRSVFSPEKSSKLPYLIVMISTLLFLGCIGAIGYLIFLY